MKTSLVRRSFVSSIASGKAASTAAGMLALLAGAASSHAAIVTFTPTCAPFAWNSVCTQFNVCGVGNSQHLNSNNWGSSVCGAGPIFPGAADQVVFAGNGTIDVAPQVIRITVNPGVTVGLGAGYDVTDVSNGFTNNGTLNGLAGNQTWTGVFTNNGTFTEDFAGWTRGLNSVTFSNAGTLNLPGGTIWTIGSGSNSLINLVSGTINKTPGGTFSTNVALSNFGVINVTGGTFRLFSNQYTGNGGTITTSGTGEFLLENTTLALNILGTSNSSIRSSGTLTIAGGPGATLNIGGNGLAIGSNLTVTGFLTNNNSVTTLAGNQAWTGGTLTNNGTWTEDNAGWTRGWNNFIFRNNGTLNLPGGVIWSGSSGSNTLENNGTINKTGSATFNTNIPVSNPVPGTIALAANGGTFLVTDTSYSGGGQLLPQSGSEVLFNNVFFNGNGGTVTGTVPAGASIRTTGTISSPGVGATFNIQGQGITFNGNIGGSNGFTNSGIARTAGGNQTWSANSIVNNGTWTEDTAGWTRLFAGIAFTNNATLNLPGSVIWSFNSGSPSITNNATINKSGGGTFTTNVSVTNASTGSIVVPANGGTFRINGAAYSGTGQLLSQGTNSEILFNGTFFNGNSGTVTGSVAPGGSIRTTGTITSPGIGARFNIQGEGISFNGDFGGGNGFTNNGIARTLSGNQTWGTNAIVNNGTWTEDGAGWSRGLVNTQFTNNGTLNVPGSVNWGVNSGSPTITNNGTINKTPGGTFSANFGVTNTSFIDVAGGSFNPGGLAQSAANARTLVRSGASLGGGNHSLAGGRLEGRGTVTTNFTTTGATVAPGESPSQNGVLTFNGTYTQTPAGIYEVSLFGRPSQPHDRLQVGGVASLGGALRVVITAPFLPKLGDVYEIVRSNTSRTGTFSSVQVIGPSAVTVSVSYTATAAFLTITGTECGSIDFNNDGAFFDPTDIDAFLSVFSEGPCIPGAATCNDVDFNNDAALFDPCDIDSFLLVFSEGPCTLCGV
jgi:hypothetical protein